MGGEKSGLFPLALNSWGSSPHGRGKGDLDFDALASIGITPAQAGKSGCTWTISSAWRDHPRVGGEKSASMAA